LKKVSKKPTGTAADAVYVPKWFLYEHLQFMRGTQTINETVSSTQPQDAVVHETIVHEVTAEAAGLNEAVSYVFQ
jgi:hypothetical protein